MATSPLYNLVGAWSSTTQYNYLDAVTYKRYTYICTASGGSLNQNPTQVPAVWVQMPQISQEDQYYLRSRETLLPYEDARFNSLVNAMCNFYTTKNDQSIWGSFLRAVAMELSRMEYMYSYDVISKDPAYLTPPDIKRQYADPMFVAGNFQQLSQFDSGNFGTPFNNWVANTGVILNTAIIDSNGNLQLCTVAGTSGSSEPLWALGEGLTTADGSELVWTNIGVPPAPLTYPIGYRDMLVALLYAYQEGATPKSIQDVIYAYTGKNITVEELYKQITPGGFYDQSDRNAVKVSVNVGGSDPLTDIQSLTELQQITTSLYGAIDLAKPAHVGLEFTTVFGANENIDCYISPRYLTQYQLNTLSSAQASYYILVAYVLVSTIQPWSISTLFSLGTVIQDSNGNIQMVTTAGVSGGSKPAWNTSVHGVTTDGQVHWVNLGTVEITISAYQALPASQQANYQAYYQNLNCSGSGIDDILRIIVQQVEEPPFNPMLYQAPIFNVNNPTTTLASYGRIFLTPLSQTVWSTLLSTPSVWSGLTTYSKGTLVRGRAFPATNSWILYRAKKKSTNRDPLTDTSQTYWIPLPSPSMYQAYYQASNGYYVLGIRQWAPTTAFYTGQFMVDSNGNLQIASVGGTTGAIQTISSSLNSVVVSNNTLTVKTGSTIGLGSSVTFLGLTYASFLNGKTVSVTSHTSNTITATFEHANYSSANAETGTIQTAFNSVTGETTTDGGVTWINLGSNYLTDPSKWIQVVGNDNIPTSETSNWDITHPMGLLAPRQDLCWEISGGDTFASYEYEG